MKTAIIVDFDARRVLFQKIVGSLKLVSALEDWDLNWGEPFIAVTKDRRIWVRIFYEESLPASVEKLKGEMERLKPHLPSEGELCLCVPQSWTLNGENLLKELSFPARVWGYSNAGNGYVSSYEMVQAQSPAAFPEASAVKAASPKPSTAFFERRLNSDEIRELAEMGMVLRRFAAGKTASL